MQHQMWTIRINDAPSKAKRRGSVVVKAHCNAGDNRACKLFSYVLDKWLKPSRPSMRNTAKPYLFTRTGAIVFHITRLPGYAHTPFHFRFARPKCFHKMLCRFRELDHEA